MKIQKMAKNVGKFVKNNPGKTAAAAGFLHSGPVGAAIGAGAVKAYQHRNQIKGAIKKGFKKVRNTIKRR